MSLLFAPRILKYRCRRQSRPNWVRNKMLKYSYFFSQNIPFFKHVRHVELKLLQTIHENWQNVTRKCLNNNNVTISGVIYLVCAGVNVQ